MNSIRKTAAVTLDRIKLQGLPVPMLQAISRSPTWVRNTFSSIGIYNKIICIRRVLNLPLMSSLDTLQSPVSFCGESTNWSVYEKMHLSWTCSIKVALKRVQLTAQPNPSWAAHGAIQQHRNCGHCTYVGRVFPYPCPALAVSVSLLKSCASSVSGEVGSQV